MSNYALIENGIVTNIVVWDGAPFTPATDSQDAAGWSPPAGTDAILLHDGDVPVIGLGYSNGTFEQPTAPPVVLPSAADILASNTATRDILLSAASVAIAPLQMAVSLGEATDAETASAKAWVAYARAVKLIDLTQSTPTWPSLPA